MYRNILGACMYTQHICSWCLLRPEDCSESKVTEGCGMSPAQVLCKSRKCSEPLSLLFSPEIIFFTVIYH